MGLYSQLPIKSVNGQLPLPNVRSRSSGQFTFRSLAQKVQWDLFCWNDLRF
jgi:hypothetical protein